MAAAHQILALARTVVEGASATVARVPALWDGRDDCSELSEYQMLMMCYEQATG